MEPSTYGRGIIVIIPAFNEARAIGRVIEDIPDGLVDEVVVVNNASTDETAGNARAAGATVLTESRRGYGYACLKGLDYVRPRRPGIIVFLDGDYSDHPDEMPLLLAPIVDGRADFVVGSRLRGAREPDAMMPHAIAGNRLACFLIHHIWGVRFTDLGPFRAIRFDELESLSMQDKTFGWTVEMQVKAVRAGLRCEEVPVSYRRRVGVSKVTGTVGGTVKASAKILWIIARYGAAEFRRGKTSTFHKDCSEMESVVR